MGTHVEIRLRLTIEDENWWKNEKIEHSVWMSGFGMKNEDQNSE